MGDNVGTGTVHFEPQVGENPDGTFWMTLTISVGESYWTSPRAQLHAADMNAALAEARRQTLGLARVLRGKS